MPNDHPFHSVVREAYERHCATGATVFQKWTCSHCRTRQTMEEPNKFFTSGICEECKKETNIEASGCNYMLVIGGAAEPPQ